MKYKALRTIAVIFKIFGWISLVGGILSACGLGLTSVLGIASVATLAGTTSDTSAATGLLGGGILGVIAAIAIVLGGLIITGVYALMLFALAEGISVFLDIERNTREMSEYLRR